MRRWFLLALALLLAGYLLTGVTQIRPGERAVVRRFGKVVDVPRPGLYLGLPWGMDRVDRVPADLLRRVTVGYQPDRDDDSLTTPPGQLLTGDHNLINLQVVLDYAVDQGSRDSASKEDQVVDYVLHADRTDALVARSAEAALAEWVAQRNVDEVLIRGKALLPNWLVSRTQERIAPYRLGIRIQSASVAHLLPPERVKPAFDEVTRAQTAIRTREYQARQAAERILRNAEIDRVKLEREAAANANALLTMARTEAEMFEKRVQEYHRLRQQNPDILAAIWWEEMSKVFFRLKQSGRIDLLDKHIAGNGLDITQFAPQPKR